MRLTLFCIGRLKSGPERELVARYMERASLGARQVGFTAIDFVEVDESKARRPEDRKTDEAKLLRAHLTQGARLILLDERGKNLTSTDFTTQLQRQRDEGTRSIVMAIGGPDGFDPSLRSEASLVLAFGAMTWPHQMVRIMAAEQIYRATTILSGHPYHRV